MGVMGCYTSTASNTIASCSNQGPPWLPLLSSSTRWYSVIVVINPTTVSNINNVTVIVIAVTAAVATAALAAAVAAAVAVTVAASVCWLMGMGMVYSGAK